MDAFYHDLIYFNDFFPHACHDTVQQIVVVHVKVREQTVLNVLVLEVPKGRMPFPSIWFHNVGRPQLRPVVHHC